MLKLLNIYQFCNADLHPNPFIVHTVLPTPLHTHKVRYLINVRSLNQLFYSRVSNSVSVRAFKPWLFPDLTFNLSHIGQQFNKHLGYVNSYVDKVVLLSLLIHVLLIFNFNIILILFYKYHNLALLPVGKVNIHIIK